MPHARQARCVRRGHGDDGATLALGGIGLRPLPEQKPWGRASLRLRELNHFETPLRMGSRRGGPDPSEHVWNRCAECFDASGKVRHFPSEEIARGESDAWPAVSGVHRTRQGVAHLWRGHRWWWNWGTPCSRGLPTRMGRIHASGRRGGRRRWRSHPSGGHGEDTVQVRQGKPVQREVNGCREAGR